MHLQPLTKKTVLSPASKAVPPPQQIGAAVRWGAAQIAAGNTVQALHRIDARALLLDCLPFDDYARLLAAEDEPLPPEAASRYARYIAARVGGQPVAYILGWREFYGRRFKTTPAALIPRADTETLVEVALSHLPEAGRVLDLGTGCGAIGISLALARARSVVTLTDVSTAALALARENAILHKAANTRFICGSWYQPLPMTDKFDIIVSNPPYVAEGDAHLQSGDLRFEPRLALVGGADGLAALTQVISKAPAMLVRGGVLLIEHGATQAASVRAALAAAGFCGLYTQNDIAARQRVTLALLP